MGTESYKLKTLIEGLASIKKGNDRDGVKYSDKIALRKNFITGEETIDSNGLLYTKWEGLFKEITKRDMTDNEFLEYSDWWDNIAIQGESLLTWCEDKGFIAIPDKNEEPEHN